MEFKFLTHALSMILITFAVVNADARLLKDLKCTKTVHVAGLNTDVDMAAAEDLWMNGGAMAYPASAAASNVISDSANDAAAGTGARTVFIWGLDSNYDEISETATLNGTTLVALTNSYLRFLGAYVVTAGSGATNAGNISLRQSTTVYGYMGLGKGQALMASYTVPRNHRGYITGVEGSIYLAAGSLAIYDLFVRPLSGIFYQATSPFSVTTAGGSQVQRKFDSPIYIPQKTDVKISVSTVSADNTQAFGAFDLCLEKI